MRSALIVVTLLVVAGGAWAVYFSSLLAVTDVRVLGADGPHAEQVQVAAAVPLGTPLVRVDTTGIQAAVLALPWVETVEVRRGWPHEVVLVVTPRVPMASLAGSGSVVDASGSTLDAVGVLPAALLSVSADGVGLRAAMAVLAGLPADISARVQSLSATTLDDVTLRLRSGATVRWGSQEKGEFKAEVLRALLRHKREVYDVSAPELPTTFSGG